MPEFPVFTRSGEVTVSIDLVREHVTFSAEEMRRFHFFHKFLFSRVLRLDKDPMTYMPHEAPYSPLIIPVQTGHYFFSLANLPPNTFNNPHVSIQTLVKHYHRLIAMAY